MARKNNLIELTLEIKRKGTDQIGKYKKELNDLKKAANELNSSLNKTQKQLSANIKNTSVEKLGKDSEKTQAQIKKLQDALSKVSGELKEQKKLESNLRKEANGRVKNARQEAAASRKVYQNKIKGLKENNKVQKKNNEETNKGLNAIRGLGNAVATVNGPLNDYSGRINSLAQGFKNFNPLLIATVTAISAVAFALPGAIAGFAQMERQILRIQALSEQTGNSAGLTPAQFEAMTQELAYNTLTSLTQVRDAVGLLLSFPNIRGENFERVLTLSQDIAEVTGRDIKSSTEQLAKALADPIKGITKLTEVGVVFTKEQEAMIKSTQALEGTFAAQGVVLDVLASQYGGAGKKAAEGFSGALDTLGQVIENLMNTLGEASAESSFVKYLQDVTTGLKLLLESEANIKDGWFGGLRGFSERLGQLRKGSISLNEATNLLDKSLATLRNEYRSGLGINISEEEQDSALKRQIDRQREELDETLKAIADYKLEGEKIPEDLLKRAEEQGAEIAQLVADTRAQIDGLFTLQTDQELANKFLTGQDLEFTKEELNQIADLARRTGVDLDEIQISDGITSKPLRNELREIEKEISELDGVGVFNTAEEEKRLKELKALYQEYVQDIGQTFAGRIREVEQASESLGDGAGEVSNQAMQTRIDSYVKAGEEVKAIEEKNKEELKKLEKETSDEILAIQKRREQDKLDIRIEALRRLQRLDTDNVDIQNELLTRQSEKEELSFEIRRLELTKQRSELEEQIAERRKEFFGDDPNISQEQLDAGEFDEKLALRTADTDNPFAKTIGDLEVVEEKISRVDERIKNTQDSLSEELRINVQINQQKIDDQINTFIEDSNIKQKELRASLQGNTEESLENQLSAIDDKYDKALDNLEEKIGELPKRVTDKAASEKSLEKTKTTFDSLSKRFKDLNQEYKDGKISVDSYTESVKILNAELDKTGDKVDIEIKDLDPTKTFQEGVKNLSGDMSKEIDNIKNSIEDADLSEGFELRRQALVKLKEYTNELLKIKEIDPDVDITEAVQKIQDLRREVKMTYTESEKTLRKLADDMAANFADGIKEMVTEGGTSMREILKNSVAEAFGNYASDRIQDMIFYGVQSGLRKLGENLFSDFFNEIDFFEFFSGEDEDENVINYKKLEGSFESSLKNNTKNKQNVVITNAEDIKAKEGKIKEDDSKDIMKELIGPGLALLGIGGASGADDFVKNAFDSLGDNKIIKDSGVDLPKQEPKFTDDVKEGFSPDMEENISGISDKLGDILDTDKLKDAFTPDDPKGGSINPFSDTEGADQGFFGSIMEFFKNMVGRIKELIPGFDNIATFFGDLLGDFGGISGIFENLLSSFGGVGDFFSVLIDSLGGLGSTLSSVFGGLTGGLFHDGGLVGSGGGTPIAISPSSFKNPKYFHDGGYTSGSNLKSDEMAAILQKGEYVIDRSTTEAMLKGNKKGSGGSGGTNITNVIGGDEVVNSLKGNQNSDDNIINVIKSRSSEVQNFLNR